MDSALTNDVALRNVQADDLPTFFNYQLDAGANHMAAFMPRDPADRNAFTAHWSKMLADNTVTLRTILFDGNVAGHVAKFERSGQPEVTYWIAKQYWGRGVATKALSALLTEVKVRPIHAGAAKDNLASIRVLEKCGFTICGQDKAFAQARGHEIEEVILKLT